MACYHCASWPMPCSQHGAGKGGHTLSVLFSKTEKDALGAGEGYSPKQSCRLDWPYSPFSYHARTNILLFPLVALASLASNPTDNGVSVGSPLRSPSLQSHNRICHILFFCSTSLHQSPPPSLNSLSLPFSSTSWRILTLKFLAPVQVPILAFRPCTPDP